MAWTPEQKREARRRKAEQEGRVLGERVLEPHGTGAAARRHERAGEPLCDLCASWRREWRREYQRQYRARKNS